VSAKWSVRILIQDQFGTLVNERTRRPWIPDYVVFYVIPAASGASSYLMNFRLGDVDGILAGVAILTGLLFALVIHVFTLGLRITDDPRIADGSRISRLVDQVEANVSYAVLVGLATTVVLSIASGTTESGHRIGKLMTAILVALLIHLILIMLMILKRMRSSYREFRK
jgi:di/tricarboxylate transporter